MATGDQDQRHGRDQDRRRSQGEHALWREAGGDQPAAGKRPEDGADTTDTQGQPVPVARNGVG